MKVWKFHGPGVCLGAECTIIARTERVARRLMEEWCVDHQVNPRTMELNGDPVHFESPMLVHGWNGDY